MPIIDRIKRWHIILSFTVGVGGAGFGVASFIWKTAGAYQILVDNDSTFRDDINGLKEIVHDYQADKQAQAAKDNDLDTRLQIAEFKTKVLYFHDFHTPFSLSDAFIVPDDSYIASHQDKLRSW